MEEQEKIFDWLAKECKITAAEMKAIISARIERGWNNPDLERREQWRKSTYKGEVPTPEEWIKYVAGKLKGDGRKDLLQ